MFFCSSGICTNLISNVANFVKFVFNVHIKSMFLCMSGDDELQHFHACSSLTQSSSCLKWHLRLPQESATAVGLRPVW